MRALVFTGSPLPLVLLCLLVVPPGRLLGAVPCPRAQAWHHQAEQDRPLQRTGLHVCLLDPRHHRRNLRHGPLADKLVQDRGVLPG